MNQRLKSMIAVVAIVSIGGVRYYYATRQPPDITMAELRDAGAASERTDRWVYCAPEVLDRRTRNRLINDGYGNFKIGSIHRICRTMWQYDHVDFTIGEDASVALSLSNVFGDAGLDDGGVATGENAVSGLETFSGGYRVECNDADGGIRELRFLQDGGFRYEQSPGVEDPFCTAINRPGRVTPPCVIPDCWTLPDAGWNDSAVVDCQGIGPYGNQPGGTPRWRGCNVTPSVFSVGTQCIPVECTTKPGDPTDVLR